jgi:hypothetical protein
LFPWPEIADQVVLVFETLIEAEGHASTASHLLAEQGVRFPDFRYHKAPDGFFCPPQGGPYVGYPSDASIRGMVTNPVYLGHWLYKGAITRWNNYEPLIGEPMFYKAFNYFSRNNLDGSENTSFRPVGERKKRKSFPARDAAVAPVLNGLLYVEFEEKCRKLSVKWNNRREKYTYLYSVWRGKFVTWERRAETLDEAVAFHLHERLRETFNATIFEQEARKGSKKAKTDVRVYDQLIRDLQQKRSNTIVALTNLSNQNALFELEKQFEAFEAEIARLQAARLEAVATRTSAAELLPFKDEYLRAIDNWPNLTRTEKQTIIRQFIRRIEITDWRGSTLGLTIYWYDEPVTTSVEVWMAPRGHWTYLDKLKITAMLEQGASREAMLAAFPDETWDTLRRFIRRFHPDAPLPILENPIPGWEARWGEKDGRTDSHVSRSDLRKH